MPSSAPTIAYFTVGSNSHTTASVHDQLVKRFPEHRVVRIDIVDQLLKPHHRRETWCNLLPMLRCYGLDYLFRRRRFWSTFYHTPHMFESIRAFAAEAVAALGNVEFTFQLQSLCDTSVPGVPHFVYTDHTHLTSLYYPGVQRQELLPQFWIDLERIIYQHATCVFTMSSHVTRSLLEHYGMHADRVVCVYGGPNTPVPLSVIGDQSSVIGDPLSAIGTQDTGPSSQEPACNVESALINRPRPQRSGPRPRTPTVFEHKSRTTTRTSTIGQKSTFWSELNAQRSMSADAVSDPQLSAFLPHPSASVTRPTAHRSPATDPSGTVPPHPVRILFVGVEWERKGGPDLLNAFRELRTRLPDVELTVVGCTPDVRGVPNVRVAGCVAREDVAGFYREADIFCVPTRREPFGIVFLEAAHFGLPVVATDIGALPDIVEPGVTGCLVPSGDIVALVSALTKLVLDAGLRHRLGEAARQRARRFYTWDGTGERLRQEILARLLPTR